MSDSSGLSSWLLRPGWRASSNGKQGLAFLSEDQKFVVSCGSAVLASVWPLIENGAVVADDRNRDVIADLVSRGVLVERLEGANEAVARSRAARFWERVGVSPETVGQKLETTVGLVAGVGGLGTQVLCHLAAIGVGTVVVIDFDVVEAENLEQQFLYQRDDIGKKKAVVAARRVHDRFDATVVPVDRVIESGVDIEDIIDVYGPVDFGVVCIATPPASAFSVCADGFTASGVPFIGGGVSTTKGFITPIFGAESSPSFASVMGFRSSATEVLDACFPPYNTVIGALIAADIIRFLAEPDTERPDDLTVINFKERSLGTLVR